MKRSSVQPAIGVVVNTCAWDNNRQGSVSEIGADPYSSRCSTALLLAGHGRHVPEAMRPAILAQYESSGSPAIAYQPE